MTKKTDATTSGSILTASGLSGKNITDVILTKNGSVDAIELVFSGGSAFIKVYQGRVDVGGTIEYGTGTIVNTGRQI